MVFVLRIVRFTPCPLLERSPRSARCGATSQKGAPLVQGTDRFLAADRPPAAPHVPLLGEALQRQPPGPELHLLGAVPGDGLRPAHLPGEPARPQSEGSEALADHLHARALHYKALRATDADAPGSLETLSLNPGGSDEDGQYRVPIRRRRCARGRTRSSLHT